MVAVNVRSADVVTSAQVSNSIPVASSAELNAATDITLTANQTTSVVGTATITDDNGCGEISQVNGTLYRTNITGGALAADDNRSHYFTTCVSFGDCVGAGDITETYRCEFNVTWYADPTDDGSFYNQTNWTFLITPTDGFGGVSDSAEQEVLTLTSITVTTSAINFGLLGLGTNTTNVNQNTSLVNTGNEGLDVELKGYANIEGDGLGLNCTVGDVDVNFLEYSEGTFNYGAGTDLTHLDVELDIDLDRGSEPTPRPQGMIYYGLGFPASGLSGTCTGTLVITAFSDPRLD